MKETNIRILIRNLIFELIIYGILLVIYFFLVLQYLGDILSSLFESQTLMYAVLGLGLIVAQGVLLEAVTSFLIRLLRLDRLH
jgi:hypothetical protein